MQQTFFNKNGKKVNNPADILPKFPNTIQYGNITLSASLTTPKEYANSDNFEKKIQDSFEKSYEYIGAGPIATKDIDAEVRKLIHNGKNSGTEKHYIVEFKHIPNVKILYKNPNRPAIGDIKIDNPANIDAEGNLVSEKLTRQMLDSKSNIMIAAVQIRNK